VPSPLEVILFLWLALGSLGIAFSLLLLLSVLVGGARDLSGYWHDRIEYSRRSRGLCTHCGYDLRCSRTRCPECGQYIRNYPTPRFVRI
jgi:hypothetical protein